MSLYLYLNEHWHADTWVNGGVIPINPASFYRRAERGGIFTPDENLIHRSPIDLMAPNPIFRIGPGGQIRSLYAIDNYVDGVRQTDLINAAYYQEDGLILSFSYRLTGILARKMKKKACVKILNIDSLKEHLDQQIGVKSEAGPCRYNEGHQRHHFLKSHLDMWQAEYRLFWPSSNKVEVSVQPGTAELICTW
ncbi:hypothetical protein PMI22_04225 [Pseudomonas sp. GM21]|uniref:hypothetical protein n=1 Tax=Pseudomonas sp. GM21 TaxID=1144325 RepID=UPI0002724DE9|nr:hypothetical protein [Pseudomonas sp. GM21]EJM15493.1 hypothetical protein PMI22_04225 [Pseudomonas sp. GM21]